MSLPITNVPFGKPDAERAAEIKREASEVLDMVLAVLNKAAADGFTVDFNIASGPTGKYVVTMLKISKVF